MAELVKDYSSPEKTMIDRVASHVLIDTDGVNT
jgi:hypothetical protein